MILMRKPPRILIIEDDPSVSGILKSLLTTLGYGVSSSNDGKEGLFLSRSEFFNLIILEICLPEINGISLLSKIKDFSPITEIIVITNHLNVETAVQLFKLGAFDYLIKPIDLNLMVQAINKAIARQTLEFEKGLLIAEIEFKNMLLEEQRNLLEEKLIEDDQRIFRLIKEEIFRKRLFEEMIESLPLGVSNEE